MSALCVREHVGVESEDWRDVMVEGEAGQWGKYPHSPNKHVQVHVSVFADKYSKEKHKYKTVQMQVQKIWLVLKPKFKYISTDFLSSFIDMFISNSGANAYWRNI